MNTSRDSIYFWTIIWSFWFNRLSSPATNTSTFSSHHLRIYSDRPRQAAAVVDNLDKSVRCFLPLRVFTSTPVVLILFWVFFLRPKTTQHHWMKVRKSSCLMVMKKTHSCASPCAPDSPPCASRTACDSPTVLQCPTSLTPTPQSTQQMFSSLFLPGINRMCCWSTAKTHGEERFQIVSFFQFFFFFEHLVVSVITYSQICYKKSWDVWLSCLVVSLVQICLCFRFFLVSVLWF